MLAYVILFYPDKIQAPSQLRPCSHPGNAQPGPCTTWSEQSACCRNGVIDKQELKHLLECVDNGNSCDVSVWHTPQHAPGLTQPSSL